MFGPFTYALMRSGDIAITDGWAPTDAPWPSVVGALVYSPNPQGDRAFRGRLYSKGVKRWSNLSDILNFSRHDRDYISAGLIPLAEVEEVLPQHRGCATESLDGLLRRRALEAVKLLSGYGIPPDDIGLYGSSAVGLRKRERDHGDLDLLVFGTQHYSAVVEACRGNRFDAGCVQLLFPHSRFELAATARRLELSQFRLNDGFRVDVKVIALQGNSIWTPSGKALKQGIPSTVHGFGQVVRADESLSMPARYVVRGGTGRMISIETHLFHLLGAAGQDDFVEFSGWKLDGNIVYLSDPNRHGIMRRDELIPRSLEALHYPQQMTPPTMS